MSPIDEKVKHKLKSYIIRQRKQQEKRDIQGEMYYVQRTISELQNERHMLIKKFKQVLDEFKIKKLRYERSACSQDSTIEHFPSIH